MIPQTPDIWMSRHLSLGLGTKLGLQNVNYFNDFDLGSQFTNNSVVLVRF